MGVHPANLVRAALRTSDPQNQRPSEPAGQLHGDPVAGGDAGGADEGAEGIEVAAPVSLDQIETSRNYEERIGAVRGFTRDNPARAALAVRDMIGAEAKS